ncbi:MAG: hypothetical protein KDC12_05220, partial [Flavobacteriales bacterium]|nr:hypothetical protein [Flavobacteriales bacterium]
MKQLYLISRERSVSLNGLNYAMAGLMLVMGLVWTSAANAQCQPELMLTCPGDVTLECGEENDVFLTGMPEVFSDCVEGEVTVYYTDEVVEAGCSQTIARTWVAEVDDLVEMCTQFIYTEDTTGPELIGVPADMEVDCVEEVPAQEMISASDYCNAVVNIDTYSSETGNATDSCTLSTAVGPGEDWAIWLPTLMDEGYVSGVSWVFEGDASMIMYADNTAEINGVIHNSAEPNKKFQVTMKFTNGMGWADWSALGRNYKDDLNIADGYYQDWQYYEMVNVFSHLTGMGDFAGSELYLYHMPSDYFFGFQCGERANNKNDHFGISGWFTFQGHMNGEAVEGHGDLNCDKECVPYNLQDCPNDDEFTYFWYAEDDCGNFSFATQVITVNDDVAPEFINCPADETVECDMW